MLNRLINNVSSAGWFVISGILSLMTFARPCAAKPLLRRKQQDVGSASLEPTYSNCFDLAGRLVSSVGWFKSPWRWNQHAIPINRNQSGFTLVELIVVIVITGVLSTVLLQFITVPVESYVDVSRRARLTDIADTAMQRLAYDIRSALPNSMRVGCSGRCVEFLRAPTGARYRASPPGDVLSFNPSDADTSFPVLGPLNHTSEVVIGSGAGDCASNAASCVNVYNTGLPGSNAWSMDNMATLTAIGSSPLSISFDNTAFSSGNAAFPASSPYQRFFLVDTPLKYICDTTSGTLRRYQGYNIVGNETSVDSHAELLALSNPAEHALLADKVAGCSFAYSSGTPTRNALLSISLTIAESGEDITLLQQLNVVNMP